jgi:hypothetical protein
VGTTLLVLVYKKMENNNVVWVGGWYTLRCTKVWAGRKEVRSAQHIRKREESWRGCARVCREGSNKQETTTEEQGWRV